MTTRLSTDQQATVVANFESEDTDEQRDAIAVFCEHDMTIHDVAALCMRVNGLDTPMTLDDAEGR
jgi:citrate lyase beta subunit